MAVLSNDDRRSVWRGIMRFVSRTRDSTPFLKEDLYSALAATDDWLEANATSFNSALPQPFRGQATPAQKAFLLACIALARSGMAMLRQFLTEVD